MLGKKRILQILFLLIPLAVLALVLAGITGWQDVLTREERDWLKKKGEVVFVSQTSYPPFEFTDKYGKRQGMCLELVRWIATEFGFRVRLTDATFARAQQAVLAGRADVLTSFFYSRKRDQQWDFTTVMWRIPATIFVKSDRPDILGLADLQDKRVAIQKGDYARDFLAKKGIRFVDVPCDSFEEATRFLIDGKADAVIGDEQIVLYYLYSNGLLDRLKRVGRPLYIGENCMGVRDGDKILLSILCKGIRQAGERGIINRINRKWIGTHYTGTPGWLERNIRTILFIAGAVLLGVVVVIFWNLQLRRMVGARTRELAASEEKYRNLFEAAQDGVILHDAEGRIIAVNRRFLEMYHVADRETARTLDIIRDLSSRDNGDINLHEVWRIVQEGQTREFEWKAVRQDNGCIFDVRVNLKRIRFDGRELLQATIKDITEQKRIEQDLLQAQKMEVVGALAGGLAHDFNNILAGIVGPVSLLQRRYREKKPPATASLLEFLQMIDDSAQRAAGVVTQLLALSRRESLHFQRMDLNESIRRVIDLARVSFDKSITLEVIPAREPAAIDGDSGRIEQVLLNLCINAVHAMTIMRPPDAPWQGRLTVTAEKVLADGAFLARYPQGRSGWYWAVSVADTGVGIDESCLGRIFDPFFTTKDKGAGSGLGLSMAFNIMQQHHGMIDVRTEPDAGSVFTLYFPVATTPAETPDHADKPGVVRGEGLILVVDDEPVLREVTREMLKACGYTVLTAGEGEQAVQLYRERHAGVAAVLLDMVMPGMGSKDVYTALKEIDPEVVVLLASGFGQDERVKALLKLGADGFIHKPYTLDQLSRELAETIQRRRC